jgi:hypothetical protein
MDSTAIAVSLIETMMKIALWIITCMLALLWTGGALISANLTSWFAGRVAAGDLANVGRDAAPWPQPEWLPPWIDPAALQLFQQWLLEGLRALDALLPIFSSMLGWMVPLIWLCWGFGLIVLLAGAGLLHWLIARNTAAHHAG